MRFPITVKGDALSVGSNTARDTSRAARSGTLWGALLMSAALVAPAVAQITIPITDPANLGTDGAFSPTQSTTQFLQAAVTGTWDQAGTGVGVYDASKWAVVYKFSSVNIPAGVTVSFSNHPTGAPVVWLVNGNVTINGTINLSAASSPGAATFAQPGPGGFRGGTSTPRTGGLGPGGGQYAGGEYGNGGGFGTVGLGGAGGNVYGSADLVPLIGGSGGAAGSNYGYGWGGAGGGAILIVSTGTITLNGTIIANGSQSEANVGGIGQGGGIGGGGSGGGIRLVADVLTGSPSSALTSISNPTNASRADFVRGGAGRIRTEANTDTLPIPGNPQRSIATVGTTARLWPTAAEPKVTAVSLGTEPVPSDPRAQLVFANTDVEILGGPVPIITIDCENVPVNSTVTVRLVPAAVGGSYDVRTVTATFQSGDQTSSTWTAQMPVPLIGGGGGGSVETPLPGAYTFTVSVTLP